MALPTSTAPDTSIVLTTCSRAAMLRQALASLDAQTHPSFEFILVDDRSTDSTPDLLAAFQSSSPHPVTLLQGPGKGVAAARNLAAQHARGSWLASFDDDQIADSTWLATLRATADSTQSAVVGGALTLDLPPGITPAELGPRTRRVLGEHLLGADPMPYPAGTFPATNNVLLRRDVFLASSGYDPAFTEGGEDKDLFERIAAAGHSLYFAPHAEALHITPATRLAPANLRWTSLRLGASDARVQQRKHPFFGPLRLALLRLAVTQLRDVPMWLLARLRNGPAMAARLTDIDCSLWYTQGLLRALPAIVFPNHFNDRFLRSLDFRSRNGER